MMRGFIGSPVGGVALGALAMYLLDPDQGRARRARLRDKLVRLEHVSEEAAEATRRDVRNRARGLVAELRARTHPERVDDDVLVERVRSKLGRLVSHPHALEVEAHDGRIVLRGNILADERLPLILRVRAVRGVQGVEDQLTPHAGAGSVPSLQGPGRTTGMIPRDWSPTGRLLATAGGGLLGLRALWGGGVLGAALAGAGAAIALRGLTNLPVRRWIDRTLPIRGDGPARAAAEPSAGPGPEGSPTTH